jgi:ribosomal-protein-alanine N-acetyltransferase
LTTTIGSDGDLNPEEDSGHVVGFVLSLKTEPEADCLTIAIAPEYQGRGFGKSLMDAHSQALRAHGVRTWYLEVHEHNERAIAFYKKMGFHLCARRPNYYPAWKEGETVHETPARAAALVMCCNLD